MSEPAVIRIKPYHYIHVLDNNSNVTRVECGPQTFTRQEHEKLISGPDPMIMIPPRHFCVISNPVLRDKDNKPVSDGHGQIKLRHGDEEIRYDPEPFALFPGEKLVGKVTPLTIVAPNTALRLRASRDFEDTVTKEKRKAGDEWLFEGPATYFPRVEVANLETVKAVILKPNQALKLRARKGTSDKKGKVRNAGEEWMVKDTGAYLPGVDEEIIETINAFILTDKKALHLKATQSFVDKFNKPRKAGEEWIVTLKDADTYIPDVYEQVVGEVKITTLNNRQYCVVLDPWLNGVQRYGQKDLRKGEVSFFLNPGEKLEAGIQNVVVLSDQEALLLRAKETYETKEKTFQPGERWMIYGPCDFVPDVQVEVLEVRRSIPLDENEGIYVRDVKTGKVSTIVGQTYLLKPNEELWKKDLPKQVEELLVKDRNEASGSGERDKTRVVAYRAPHNSAVQVYDFKEKKARVIFGPDLVLLGPDEQFSVVTLSGGQPKVPNQIKSLSILLGPDFMTDIITVETADHARLSLKLSYNWHFEIHDKKNEVESARIFQVPDFVGDACKAIASRVRGTVAGVSFDAFHRNSASVIRAAVFGKDVDEHTARFVFTTNNLIITNVDIQSVEPVDQKTRDSLQKSVQLAIEITTKSQEAAARQDSSRKEQEAMGKLERQKISDEAAAEKARRELIQLQTESAALESTGQATAEAKARAEANNITGEASVKQARLTADCVKIRSESELEQLNKKREIEIEHQKQLNLLEIDKAKRLGEIESQKFKAIVSSIGKGTIKAMAEAGPAAQVKLLQGLGLKSFMITDGHSPVNLFNTAQGLIGGGLPTGVTPNTN